MLAAADTTRPAGLRDRAVVLMLARLGLRRGEAASLTLDDVDWRAGSVEVRGKGSSRTLPLPADVGEALVGWVRARPARARGRALFTQTRQPWEAMTSASVGRAVSRLAERAGLGRVGAHRLRHYAATAVVNSGGSLDEAAQLLGHKSAATTLIYAKTDLASLRELVRPWPLERA
jgi:integrase